LRRTAMSKAPNNTPRTEPRPARGGAALQFISRSRRVRSGGLRACGAKRAPLTVLTRAATKPAVLTATRDRGAPNMLRS
jgi:hypothetical protein